ncbi:hypothetical protein TMUPMC115_2273 [Tetragenococcus muriaticus PMC-11-5]|uniref:Uncharacterized protein n=2 Tax=Tetragenococcus muriaticus TaxID=64642 RepID=A0A091BV51_9ENTE|nr:hypothetical protein TMU3MR103_1980 [Tetragenococcus muriaticus 3MR10-3]KFN89770.1 hypothetical protein TMUPMC115_2273 [Tetragenococcus muriaticus PMC-11-5]GMA48018.1 hypothetical protein GCM10025854_22680 [Tetragenococcus muriaticus]
MDIIVENNRDLNGETLRSIAPVSLMMAIFLLAYTIWFGFAWGLFGWILFTVSLFISTILFVKSIQNIKHSKLFEVHETKSGKRIGKAMGILSGVSYGILWLSVIILIIIDWYALIMPVVTLIIGLHFFPQAKIMNRKLDYFVAPIPIATALISIILVINSDLPWQSAFAIASIGGAIATIIYGFHILSTYQQLTSHNAANKNGKMP